MLFLIVYYRTSSVKIFLPTALLFTNFTKNNAIKTYLLFIVNIGYLFIFILIHLFWMKSPLKLLQVF